ncbi:hypothetical protein LDO32_14945 [Luteimonas sp. Y-2-2-4F]|nr:hypothetical protein [Luteimonas sp. Y-2-2-4F]MCD9033025.1 hypothetical protein [Luteimonas sp. Y-2-2-4F]
MPEAPLREISVDRDSVCMADDVDPHAARVHIRADAPVGALLDAALRACPLAAIAGGRATWIVRASGRGIAVIAQQWRRPRLLVPEEARVADLLPGDDDALHLAYWCQADPMAVFDALHTGRPLPDRHGRAGR